MENIYISQMRIVRTLLSLHNKLRQSQNKPLSEYILDIAYGGEKPKDYYLLPEFRTELAKACEVYDLGYDLSSLESYEHHNNLAQKPLGGQWVCVEEDGLYFCYDNSTPVWLLDKNSQRKEHRDKMKQRKESGIYV